MRTAACLAVVAALSLVRGAWAMPARGTDSAVVTLSSNRAGARPVAVTLMLRSELRCGRLPGRTLSLRLPARERVPKRIAATAVLVNRVHASSVTVSKHTLTIGIPRPKGAACYAIRPGPARLVITRAAGLGNPKIPGAYAFVVRHGAETATAWASIRA